MTDAELAHRFQNKTNENMRKRDKKNASENFIADSKNIQNKVSARNKSQKTPLRNVDQKVKTDQFIASANARNKTRAKKEEEKWVRQTTTKDGIEVWTRDCRSANASLLCPRSGHEDAMSSIYKRDSLCRRAAVPASPQHCCTVL